MKGFLLFAVLLAALLFGCIASPWQYAGAPHPSGQQANNTEAPTIVYKYVCADGSDAGNASGCPVARQNKTLDEMVKECGDSSCVIALAVQYENPGICTSAGFDSENCYATLAMRFKNKGYCALAQGYGPQRCDDAYDQAYLQTQEANCTQNKTVEELYAACASDVGCITTLAVQYENPALCARLLTGIYPLSYNNANNCYMALATRYQNKAYCSLIVADSLLDQDCNQGVAK